MRPGVLRALVALYPRAWRERYGDELTDLVRAMSAENAGWRVVLDLLRGAVDAHLHWRPADCRRTATGALATGVRFGLAIGAVLAAVLVLTNVVFPPGAGESDDLDLVGQQHDKQAAFAASGWSSMRAYLTVRTLVGALVVVPAVTVLGGLLGAAGGALPCGPARRGAR